MALRNSVKKGVNPQVVKLLNSYMETVIISSEFFCSSEMVKAVLLEIINSKSLDLPYEIRNANDWFAQSEIGYFLDELEKMCNKLYTRFLMLAFTG